MEKDKGEQPTFSKRDTREFDRGSASLLNCCKIKPWSFQTQTAQFKNQAISDGKSKKTTPVILSQKPEFSHALAGDVRFH